jgi:hypothetical protein
MHEIELYMIFDSRSWYLFCKECDIRLIPGHFLTSDRSSGSQTSHPRQFALEKSGESPNWLPLCENIHRGYVNLQYLARMSCKVPTMNSLFTADYSDRGSQSLDTISYLLAIKRKSSYLLAVRISDESTDRCDGK